MPRGITETGLTQCVRPVILSLRRAPLQFATKKPFRLKIWLFCFLFGSMVSRNACEKGYFWAENLLLGGQINNQIVADFDVEEGWFIPRRKDDHVFALVVMGKHGFCLFFIYFIVTIPICVVVYFCLTVQGLVCTKGCGYHDTHDDNDVCRRHC